MRDISFQANGSFTRKPPQSVADMSLKRPVKISRKGGRADSATATARSKSERRKNLISEAVIAVIAKEGARGLTHREVDRHLKLSPGSTSFYFRRRSDLLKAGFEKLIADNLQKMQQNVDEALEDLGPSELVEIKQVADYLYRGWKRASGPAWRQRIIARFEFFLAATRDKTLRAMQDKNLQKLFAIDVQLCRRMGVKNPRWVAAEIGNLRRGEMTTYVLVPSSIWGRAPTLQYYEARLRHIIAEADGYPNDLSSTHMSKSSRR
jgi:DNA-binding transcriptional regulator YbjK